MKWRAAHLCPDCLSAYKNSRAGRLARNTGVEWGHGHWPKSLHHEGYTRKCQRHHAIAADGAARRRIAERRATISPEHSRQIQAIYERSAELTNLTGVRHEVDHIVPLNGVLVSGLHVPWNLEPIRHSINARKGNKFEVG